MKIPWWQQVIAKMDCKITEHHAEVFVLQLILIVRIAEQVNVANKDYQMIYVPQPED